MKTYNVTIEGVAPLLQHKFGIEAQAELTKGARKATGSPDYSEEWKDTMYATEDGFLYQHAIHIEAMLIEAAKGFRIKGGRGKSYREAFQSCIFVSPEQIIHLRDGEQVKAPENPTPDPRQPVYLDIRPVRIQRARVVRCRLAFAPGWRLNFTLENHDPDQLRDEVIQEILEEGGRRKAIGDYRPRYGRFRVVSFEVDGQA